MITPLTISKRKLFASLSQAKHRREHRLFVVEGSKALGEMLDSALTKPAAIAATESWWESAAEASLGADVERYKATSKDLQQISNLVTAPDVIGIFRMPDNGLDYHTDIDGKLVVALDDVQDPGNMGTIIRLADWWGVETIVCSRDTVDCYNPKVVQSAMGALARVKVVKVESLASVLEDARSRGVKIYGTFMNGENLFAASLAATGVIVMGNEGNGISADVEKTVSHRLTIPSYPPGRPHVESLNVATATAIALARFRNPK